MSCFLWSLQKRTICMPFNHKCSPNMLLGGHIKLPMISLFAHSTWFLVWSKQFSLFVFHAVRQPPAKCCWEIVVVSVGSHHDHLWHLPGLANVLWSHDLSPWKQRGLWARHLWHPPFPNHQPFMCIYHHLWKQTWNIKCLQHVRPGLLEMPFNLHLC